MNRLQKKCFIVSIGLHLLLLSLLVLGPAFVSPQKPVPDLPIIDFIPLRTTDEAVTGGGDPNGRLPSSPPPRERTESKPKPAPPQPDPEPERAKPTPKPQRGPEPERARPVPKPEPRKEQATEDPDSLKPAQKWTPRKPEISTKLITRQPDSSSRARNEAQEQARRLAEARRRVLSQFDSVADRLGSDLSSSTSIELKGPGGGGIPYANWLQAIKSLYDQAWVLPSGVTDDDATATASITIARDGTVLAHRITRSSGNSGVDRSVLAALDRVKHAAPLPDGAREDERTVSINFNAQSKSKR